MPRPLIGRSGLLNPVQRSFSNRQAPCHNYSSYSLLHLCFRSYAVRWSSLLVDESGQIARSEKREARSMYMANGHLGGSTGCVSMGPIQARMGVTEVGIGWLCTIHGRCRLYSMSLGVSICVYVSMCVCVYVCLSMGSETSPTIPNPWLGMS